jgi:hypothetical protein
LDPLHKSDAIDDLIFNKLKFHRVYVDGLITTENILKACNDVGLEPVCDYPSYADGKCLIAGTHSSFHLSHGAHNKQYGFNPQPYAFFYSGKANGGRALQNTPGSHRWSNDNDIGGNTYCVKPEKRPNSFVYHGKTLVRVAVKGQMTNQNILKHCKAKNMKPPCDLPSWQVSGLQVQ